MTRPYIEIHETSIKILELINTAYNQIGVRNISLRFSGDLFPELAKKWNHEKEILYMSIKRLQERHCKQVEKLRYSYYDDNGVFDLAFERLDIANPNPDRLIEIAELMGLEYDETLRYWYDPEEILE